jgi:hypothetical protein
MFASMLSRPVRFDAHLLEQILTIISNSKKYTNVLYPSMGNNQQLSTSQGGGVYKINAYSDIAMELFRDHPKHKGYIAAIEANPNSKPSGAAKKVWGGKVKNAVKWYVFST